MPAIHQLVAGYSRGDAISNEARVMRDIFRDWGYASEIYCETGRILPELRTDARDLSEAPSTIGPDDIALLHLSIGSPANTCFKSLRARRALLYHNITPDRYFRAINPQTAHLLERGRHDIEMLAGTADVVMADSAYNAAELQSAGYGDVAVLPLILDLSKLEGGIDRRTARQLAVPGTTLLFVGRCAPNKRIDDLLVLFAWYTRTIDPDAHLVHVGSYAGVEPYHALLLARCRELDLKHVTFAGSVSQASLNAYYQRADAFVSVSEHEGFCIPLIEAMVHDCPVVAIGDAAVPETLDGAGMLLRERDYPVMAEAVARVAVPGPTREAVLQTQRDRIARYRARDLACELREHLGALLCTT